MRDKYSIILDVYKDLSLSTEELDYVVSQFEELSVNKGDILFRNGDIVYYQYYIIEGCLRSYLIDEFGKEHTLQFAIKDWWISDYTAFFSTTKAITNLECIQNSTILRISRKNMLLLYRSVPKILTFNRIKLEKAHSNLLKRLLKKSSKTAKERYVSFVNTYPNIEQNIRNYHIASYLGITTETLSRIRNEISKRN